MLPPGGRFLDALLSDQGLPGTQYGRCEEEPELLHRAERGKRVQFRIVRVRKKPHAPAQQFAEGKFYFTGFRTRVRFAACEVWGEIF